MPYIGVSPQFGVRRKHTYTATAGQTSFSGAGSEGATLSYKDSTFVDVYQNGVKLGEADYTSTSGTAIVLLQGASVSDLIEIVVFDVFSVSDTVSKADGGSFDSAVTMSNNLTVAGTTTLNTKLATTNLGTGAILQVKYFQLTTSQEETYGTANTDQAVTNFVVNITPTASNSIFKLETNIMFESENVAWSTMWFFYRDTTKLANTQGSPGDRKIGISPSLSSLDSDNNSTPEMAMLVYFDAPSTTSAINYKLGVNTTGTNSFFINRTIADTDSTSFDRGVSFLSVTEIAG